MISALSWIPRGAANLAAPEQAEAAGDQDLEDTGLTENTEVEQAQRFAAAIKASAAGPGTHEDGR